jgi:hypothetical protein
MMRCEVAPVVEPPTFTKEQEARLRIHELSVIDTLNREHSRAR